MTPTLSPAPEDSVPAGSSTPGRPLRCLMEPTAQTGAARWRWVTEANGHPGYCGPDHWHWTAEAALRCFRGER